MLGRKDVAEMLGVTPRTVDRLIRKGAFPIYRVGKYVKIMRDDVLKFLEAQKQTFNG